MKVLLVGQAPSRGGDPSRPLIGVRSGKRLQELCGMTLLQYARAFDRVNLLDRWPGSYGGGDKFPIREAREAGRRLAPSLHGRRVVLLGKNVAKALGADDMPLFKFEQRGGYVRGKRYDVEVAVVPHPSGVNRWWNDPRNQAKARRFFRTLCASTGQTRSSKAQRGGTT